MILAQRKYTVWDIVTLSFRCAPWPAGILTLLKIGEGLVPTLSILATASFVDTALAVAGGTERMARIWLPLACVVLAYNWVQDSTAGMARDRLLQDVRLNYRSALLEKRARLAFRNIEDHNAWDLIERVFKEPEIAITNGMAEVLVALTVVMRVAGLLSVLLFQAWWSAPLILGISIPLFWLAMKAGHVIYDAERETSRMDRRSNYLLQWLFDGVSSAAKGLSGAGTAVWFTVLAGMISILQLIINSANNYLSLSYEQRTGGRIRSLLNQKAGRIEPVAWEDPSHLDAINKAQEGIGELVSMYQSVNWVVAFYIPYR